MKSLKRFFFLILIMVVYSANLLAFKGAGHVFIEKNAYQALKNEKAKDGVPSGNVIYDKLFESKILLKESGINSARPDLDFTRQFIADKQAFHFMASPSAVKKALKEATREKQKLSMVKSALPTCYKMIYTMSREIIDNPVGALEAGRGTYVLIHAITDSYSKDHVERTAGTNEIECIKSWELSKLHWSKAAKDTVQNTPNTEAKRMLFLHTAAGEPDFEWIDENGDITENGKEAILAIKELLVMLYLASEDKAKSDELVVAYIKKFFKPSGAKLNDDDEFVFPSGSTQFLPSSYDAIQICYDTIYNSKNSRVYSIDYDRYDRHSFTIGCQNIFSELGARSFSFEYGFTVTPGSASSKNSWRKRIPVGYHVSISENSATFSELDFYETLQLQFSIKPQLFLPMIGDLMVQPKIGYGLAPFLDGGIINSLVLGVDFTWNIFYDYGRINSATKRLRTTLFYEFDTAALPSRHSIGLRFGFNTWQGRVIRK